MSVLSQFTNVLHVKTNFLTNVEFSCVGRDTRCVSSASCCFSKLCISHVQCVKHGGADSLGSFSLTKVWSLYNWNCSDAANEAWSWRWTGGTTVCVGFTLCGWKKVEKVKGPKKSCVYTSQLFPKSCRWSLTFQRSEAFTLVLMTHVFPGFQRNSRTSCDCIPVKNSCWPVCLITTTCRQDACCEGR